MKKKFILRNCNMILSHQTMPFQSIIKYIFCKLLK